MSVPTIWRDLRRFTPARVALGRVGNGLPTAAHLAFQAAHAAARDAVHAALDVARLQADLAAAGIESQTVRSACRGRQEYLVRPDLGRRLDAGDRGALVPMAGRVRFVICDGLSAVAVQRHAAPLLSELSPLLGGIAPVVIGLQGRVALGDDIGECVQAEAVAVLIGERPGLSAADSMGVYLTWKARPGIVDSARNCISNIRPDGLPIPRAARKLAWLIGEMARRGLTGITLKDDQGLLGSDNIPDIQ